MQLQEATSSPVPASRPAGLREQHKTKTHDALVTAAESMFKDQGFAATTVAQICAAADVSERTFFRYFESKEALLLPGLADFFDTAQRALADRPIGEEPLTAFQHAIVAGWLAQAAGGGIAALPVAMAGAGPGLAGRVAKSFMAWEEQITDVYVERLRAAEPGLVEPELTTRAAVCAGIAVATARAVLRVARRLQGQVPDLAPPVILTACFQIASAGCGRERLPTVAG